MHKAEISFFVVDHKTITFKYTENECILFKEAKLINLIYIDLTADTLNWFSLFKLDYLFIALYYRQLSVDSKIKRYKITNLVLILL